MKNNAVNRYVSIRGFVGRSICFLLVVSKENNVSIERNIVIKTSLEYEKPLKILGPRFV